MRNCKIRCQPSSSRELAATQTMESLKGTSAELCFPTWRPLRHLASEDLNYGELKLRS